MPDDHSKLVPLLPIPNRTVKRLCADDSADPRVKVGHRQALTAPKTPSASPLQGVFALRYRQQPYLVLKLRTTQAEVSSTENAGALRKQKIFCFLCT